MPSIVVAEAPAKLNLALAVGPPGPDRMHPIASWMVSVDLFDHLTVWRLEPDRFSRYAILWHREARRTSDIDWSIRDDLAVRAHLALEAAVGRRLPIQLKLEKRIPVGAGLGGGSSDAAALLRAVDLLYDLRLSDRDLCAIAEPLGADVPFLLSGGSALVQGRGEHVTASPALPPLHAVVVLPACRCRTASVYRHFDALAGIAFRPDAVQRIAADPSRTPAPDALFNDLTRAAFREAPDLEGLVAAVSRLAERPAHLTGSGAAFFVLCDDDMHGMYLARAIETRLDLPAVSVRAAAAPPPVESQPQARHLAGDPVAGERCP
ncbi:MAG: hypothetical protein KF817_14065 [Phycisphaeraceae bacterium]|nr:hypothetical protein [Phycisphaeraceae bacterium]